MQTLTSEPRTKRTGGVRADGQTSLLDPEIAVSWIMNREVASVPPDLSLNSLESMLVAQDLSRVPVIDSDGVLVGIVSKTDLLAHHFDEGDTGEISPAPFGFHTQLEDRTSVADVMSQVVVTVNQDSTIARAAELMAVHRVHGLPVVGPDQSVIGWVSTLDILSWVAGLTW
jgi:acetoin utilization protein AcuB